MGKKSQPADVSQHQRHCRREKTRRSDGVLGAGNSQLQQLADQSPDVRSLQAFQQMADQSPHTRSLQAFQQMADQSPDVQGQQALQRLADDAEGPLKPMHGLSGTAPVQRYAYTAKKDWRISDTRKSAVPQASSSGGKTFHATSDIIKDADGKLLAAKSAIGLHQSNQSMEYDGKTLYSVAPYLRDQVVKDTDSEQTKKIKDINKGTRQTDDKDSRQLLALWTDCGKAARTVMGVEGTATDPKATTNVGDSQPSTSPSAYSAEMFPKAIMDFFGDKASESFLKEGVHYTKAKDAITMVEPKNAAHAKHLYWELGEAGREAFDAHVGINRYANPEIGDAYTMVTEDEMPGFAKQGSTWNFHWAGVVAKDGGDNVTLENYAINPSQEIRAAMKTLKGQPLKDKLEAIKKWAREYVDRDWVFQMYGTDAGKTFHDDHLKGGTHGNRATTFNVKK